MYAEFAPRAHQRHSAFATLLYAFLYILLWLYHRARNACKAFHTSFKRSLTVAFDTPQAPRNQLRLQNHLAISGAISSHLQHLAQLVAFSVAAGTRHVTLYDHLREIDAARLASHLCPHDLLSYQISEIGLQETRTRYSPSGPCHSHDRCCLTEETPRKAPDILLTIVKPGTGRAAIARSARMLAERQTFDSPEVTPEYVMEWLDRDDARCMLPSEPDVVVVIPPPGGRSVPTLNEFPVWQLRLTQIRFSATPITDLSIEEFSDIAASAASAPKRFGR